MSDLYFHLGQTQEDENSLEKLEKISKSIFLGESISRSIKARIEINKIKNAKEKKSWRIYLAGWNKIPKVHKDQGEPWLLTYLKNEKQIPSDKVN